MARVSDLKVGEIYDCEGRRARVDQISFTPNRVASVTISTGRNFERKRVLTGSRWVPENIAAIGDTWERTKERKRREKHFRDQSRELCARIRDLPPEMGLSGAHISSSGRLAVYGSLQGLTGLVEALEQYAESPQESALSDLLS